MNELLIYVTAPDEVTARQLAQTLVQERLVACANLLPGVTSIYQWQGDIEESSEVVLLAKSTAERFEQIEARVVELHPYECPCVVAIPLKYGHGPFLKWIQKETEGKS